MYSADEIKLKFNEIKKTNMVGASEQLFGLCEQPKNNCPYIDRKIDLLFSDIDCLLGMLDKITSTPNPGKEEIQAFKSKIQDFYKYENYLNELRTNFENLREWGEDWKKLSKKLIIENQLIDKYKI
jgi:hypothetical protein